MGGVPNQRMTNPINEPSTTATMPGPPTALPWSKPFTCPPDLPDGWGNLTSRRSYRCLPSFLLPPKTNTVTNIVTTSVTTNERSLSPTNHDDEWGQFVTLEEEEEQRQASA